MNFEKIGDSANIIDPDEVVHNESSDLGILCFSTGFCLACEAEARHMYCFSGCVVVIVVVNFFVFRSFSRKL